VVVRPEHAGADHRRECREPHRHGDNIVYFGTDTRISPALADGTEFVIRAQSRRGGEVGLEPGERAGAASSAMRVAQILKD
jgi:hypothetical protein